MRARRFVAFAAALAVVITGLAIRHGAASDAGAPGSDAGPAPAAAAGAAEPESGPPPAGAPQIVTVGAFLRNVESIDLQNNTYYLSFALWLKWKGPIDPTKTLRFANVIEASSLSVEPQYEAPIAVDGHRYQQLHVEGKFFHKFWLGTFPLDWQRVTLEVEDSRYSTEQLIYEPDTSDSGVSRYLKIPGWRIVEVTNQRFDRELETDYGLGSARPGDTRPGFRFGLRIERPMKFFLFKIIPPILVTLACCIMVFLLRPTYVDARVGTPIAALLTAVFLQLTFTGNLPNVGIMLLIDHIFNFSYLAIFAVLVVCMVSARMVEEVGELGSVVSDSEASAADREAAAAEIKELYRRMEALDRRAIFALPITYGVGVIGVTILVRGSYFFEMMFR